MMAFWGIKLKPDMVQDLARLSSAIRSDIESDAITWEHPGDYHLTLKFLTHGTPELLEKMSEQLTKYASRLNGFDLSLEGVNFFKQDRGRMVIWVGVDSFVSKTLQRVENEVEKELAACGLKIEEHNFIPHITIARAAHHTEELEDRLRNFANWRSTHRMRTDAIVYMRRRKNPQLHEALFETVRTIYLGGESCSP